MNDSNSRSFTAGTLLVLATVIIWGVQFPIAKHTFETVDAFHSAIFRFSIPALILAVVLVLREGWSALRTGPNTTKVLVLGVMGMCAAPSLIFGGLMFTRPEIAAVIVATQPLITVLVQRVMGGVRPGLVPLFCVGVAFLGVVTVVTRWQTTLEISSVEIAANLMILAGALVFVMYTIACTSFEQWTSLRLTTLCMLSGAAANTLLVFILVTAGVLIQPSMTDWFQVRWELLFLAIVGVLIAMFTWVIGARKIGPLNAMLFINLIPVVTFTVRYWQGYRYETIEIVGAVMVMVALSIQNLYMRMQLSKHAIASLP